MRSLDESYTIFKMGQKITLLLVEQVANSLRVPMGARGNT